MSADRDVTPIVRTWLQDGVTSLPDQVLDHVLAQVPAIRQERGWLVGRRNPAMQNALKLAIAAAAVIAVVVAGFNLVSQLDSGIGGPTATPSGSPKATPSPSATPTTDVEQITMKVAGSPVRLTVDKPTGWSDVDGPNPFAIDRGGTTPPNGMVISFTVPTATFEEPCQQVPVSPPVGPTVDDLVQALREVPNHTTTDPVSTTFGGLPATYLEMTTDDVLPCATQEFYLYDGIYVQGPGQIGRMWVLEVDGGRIVATALHYPEATDEMLAEEQLIVDSVQFE